MEFYRALQLLVLALLIQGCGFQPVLPLQVDASYQPIYISGDRHLAIALQRELLANGVQLADTANGAASALLFEDANEENRSLTVNADGRDTEYLRQAGAELRWRAANGATLLETTLYTEAIQVANPDRPLAADAEYELLREAMREELVEQALRAMRHAQRQ